LEHANAPEFTFTVSNQSENIQRMVEARMRQKKMPIFFYSFY